MPFCPSCRAEYRDGTSQCNDCEVDLVEVLAEITSDVKMMNVYECYAPQLAGRAMAILEDAELEPMLRDRVSHAFPTTVGTTAARMIAVPKGRGKDAREVLRQAIKDEVIDDSGKILEP